MSNAYLATLDAKSFLFKVFWNAGQSVAILNLFPIRYFLNFLELLIWLILRVRNLNISSVVGKFSCSYISMGEILYHILSVIKLLQIPDCSYRCVALV